MCESLGRCWWCDHQFEECDVNGEGPNIQTHGYRRNRDRCTVPFLPRLFICSGCLEAAKTTRNKLSPSPWATTTYMTKSLKSFYRKVRTGKLDIGLRVTFDLVEGGGQLRKSAEKDMALTANVAYGGA